MNEWDKRIREHSVWDVMRTVGPAIDAASSVDASSSPETIAGIERLKAILAYCGKRIAAADPAITPPSALDTIANAFAAVQNELVAYVSDRQEAHITTANLTADTVLTSIGQIPGAYSPEELGALIGVTVEFRNLVLDALSETENRFRKLSADYDQSLKILAAKAEDNSTTLNARTDVLQTTLASLTASIEAERQRLTSIASEQQGQFSTSQDARSKEFNDNFRVSNERFTQLITEYQSQFSAAQDTRGKDNAAAESARQAKYNETIAEFAKKLAEQDAAFTKQRDAFVTEGEDNLFHLVSEYGEKATKILKDIDDKRKHVEKLVGVIGNLGVTSGYLRTANIARRGMWGWQGATLASLITLSSLAYKTLGVLEAPSGHFNWGSFAARALLLVSLGIIAAYSGTQADKLFTDERRNRKLALELEAIGPYLAPLPEDEQNKFRVQIGERSFGRDTDLHIHRKSPASLLDLLKSEQGKEVVSFIVETVTKSGKPDK